MTDEHQKQARRRAIGRHGEALSLTNYVWGAEDDYGDRPENETAGSPHAVTGRISVTQEPAETRGIEGTDLAYDAIVHVPDDADGADAIAGVEASTPPSVVERDADGTTYRVLRAMRPNTGLVELAVEVAA